MRDSSDKTIESGLRHRTTREVSLIVYDYVKMIIRTMTLPAGVIFQPWDSHEAWHGKKVPITIGDNASEFDWGIATGTCYFIQWHDFFTCCELTEARESRPGSVEHPDAERGDQAHAPASHQSALIPAGELFDRDNQGRTRLFYAAAKGARSEVERMIFRFPGTGFYPQRLGFIESKDEEGLTAADVAEKNGQEEIAALLRHQVWMMETFG